MSDYEDGLYDAKNEYLNKIESLESQNAELQKKLAIAVEALKEIAKDEPGYAAQRVLEKIAHE